VAVATHIGVPQLRGSWLGRLSREESWEQHLYTLFFVKVAAGLGVVLGVSFLFIRGRRALSAAFLIATALFLFAFQACSRPDAGRSDVSSRSHRNAAIARAAREVSRDSADSVEAR
jgi:hypothetical protein